MKRVVIIGGGFAGSIVAKSLQDEFEVILFDTKEYFEFTPGILRSIVEIEHFGKVQIMYKEYLKKTKIITEEVRNVDGKYVYYSGKKIMYDYLVICSGSSYKAPIKEQDVVFATRAKNLIDAHNKLLKAKDIVIIGGGLVGVELASEIVCKYNDKKVSLIHSGESLIERNDKKSIFYVSDFLEKRKIDIILGERVISGDNKEVRTDKGNKIRCDLVFSCTGIKANSDFMKSKMNDKLDENGFIRVNENIQVKGFKNVFSCGDVNNCNVEKTAQNAEHQAKIVVENIINIESGRKLKKYVEKNTPIVISLGKWDGIFEYNWLVFSGKVPAFLKWVIEKREMLKLRL